MASKRVHFKTAILAASSNTQKNIQAKRLIIAVRYTMGHPPNVLKMVPLGIRKTLEFP